MIHFACPGCQKAFKVPGEFAGRQTKCRHCGQTLRIPQQASAPPPTPAKPPTSLATAEQFQRRRAGQSVVIPIGAVAVVLMLAATFETSQKFLTQELAIPDYAIYGGGLLVILGLAAFSLVNWRCPVCRKHLGGSLNPKNCPKCGAPLDGKSAPVPPGTITPGIAGWLLLPVIGFIALPFFVGQFLYRHYELLRDLDARGWSRSPEAACHYTLTAIDVVGTVLLGFAALVLAVFFFFKHSWAPRLFIAYLILGLLFTLARFGVMVAGMSGNAVISRYEFFDFRKGSVLQALWASNFVWQIITCLIWIPYFLRSKRVRATFIRNY